ncbi:hypothetical protein ACTU45_36180, partial [Streptomyces sp. 24-1644]|uniref:hypothetical protein n=1 Tax=Streptomyces sp. 24-1644 TaxID=3457315 RepID=UPI003FA707C2
MPIKEVGPGQVSQGSMESTAGAEHTSPLPLRTWLTAQELTGSPAVHDAPPVGGPEWQRNAETPAWREFFEQGSSPLDLILSSLRRLEHKPTDKNASSLSTNQRDRDALHTEGIEDTTGRDGIARQVSHSRHPADT